MNIIYNKIFGNKLYLLVALAWAALSTSSCTFYYTPDGGTFGGTTTYCQGATASPNPFNYTECASTTGTFASGVLCSIQWYYNTTGGTSIATSTPLGTPTSFTSSAAGTGTTSYTPLTTTPGTFYYFANITWGPGYCPSPFLTSTQTITINPPPGPITAPPVLCLGTTATLTVPSTTGTWSSSATGTATITSGGVVTAVASGPVTISYTSAGCGAPATASINVLPLPSSITGPSSVCQGAAITLADATTGGTWSSSTTTVATADPTSGDVNGVVQGTTTITYTAPTGCIATTVVAVNGPPGPIGGPGVVCQGSTVNLTDPGTGGTWVSANTTVATISFSSGIATGAAPGTTLITYANGCGPATSATLTVNPLPALITGPSSVCLGSFTTLSDATSGGTWSSASTPIATVGSSTGVVTGAAAGSAVISYSISNGCAATQMVTVIPPLAPISGPPAVCQGLTVGLGALPAGGTWVSSTTSIATVGLTSGIVSGVSMGTALITYTAGVGCSAIRTMTVDPRAPILGTDSVCAGLSTFLTNIVGGGNWSTSLASIATVVPDSGRVTGVAPGTATVYYLLPTGCLSTATFSVVSFPGASTGTAKACPGTTTNLSNTTAGGLWISSNTGVATVSAAGTVTGVSADTVSVNYIIRPGCAVNTIVTINPLPAVITGSTPICPGTVDSLHDASPGGSWSTSTPSIATVIDTSGITTLIAGGSATIIYTLPTGCLRTKTLSVNPMPVPVVTYNANNVTFYTPDVYLSYQWYDSIIGKIPGAVSPSLAALYNEYYYVIVTDSFGCKGQSALMHFNPIWVGVKGVANNKAIKIYPNPTSGILFIESPVNVRAVISGIDGKQELEQRNAKVVDISRLADGMYFVTLYDDENNVQSIQKFIKE